MTVATDYFHAIEGRIRIKIPELKGSPAKAKEIKQRLGVHPGIDFVQANPTTGNVLVLYNSREISQNDIITIFKEELGCFCERLAIATQRQGEGLAGTVARAFMESALQTVVMALI